VPNNYFFTATLFFSESNIQLTNIFSLATRETIPFVSGKTTHPQAAFSASSNIPIQDYTVFFYTEQRYKEAA
jgi:hypothetical protein